MMLGGYVSHEVEGIGCVDDGDVAFEVTDAFIPIGRSFS